MVRKTWGSLHRLGVRKVNNYKYIQEIFKVKDSYVNGFLNLTNAIDRLLEFGYSYEEAKEYLNKEIIIWVNINIHIDLVSRQ